MDNYNTSSLEKCDEIRRALLNHDIQPTSQRVDVATLLLEKHQHLSASQVFDAMNKRGRIVSRATVYNTLSLFVEKKLIRQVTVGAGPAFYDSNADHHHHFYNEDTGVLEDIPSDRMFASKIPALPENTVQTGVDITIRVKNQPS